LLIDRRRRGAPSVPTERLEPLLNFCVPFEERSFEERCFEGFGDDGATDSTG
jgi:hypothetical protein